MNLIEIARQCVAYKQVDDAQKAYTLLLQQADGTDPAAELEAALYLFESGGDYRISFSCFQTLYNRGEFQNELFDLMVNAFYAPNLKLQEKLYQKNCRFLARYPYLFRKDFLPFDELPIKFFPFDDTGFLPFDTRKNKFSDYLNVNHPVVSRNFFRELDDPILAEDVYSQYELEYLNDNVRKSEWVARENHIYLHYTDWSVFCSYLQCLDFRALLKEEKLVFLMEEERTLYPIDFKARFGLDYSQYTVKPFGIREIKRLIWHTQLATHNGGDFFNEIFFGHPNLLVEASVMFEPLQDTIANIKEQVKQLSPQGKLEITSADTLDQNVFHQLARLKDVTEKDVLVARFLADLTANKNLDLNARIAPAMFFQPHFKNMLYDLTVDEQKRATLYSPQYQQIQDSPIFPGFRYIKTFTPMRRITTSYAASIRFMLGDSGANIESDYVVSNAIGERVLNRSFMIDWQDRLYQDSVLVRFEDGKLNPKATFTALAAFLDLPYTTSMTYCSGPDGLNPESLGGNALGFDPAPVYRTYDKYANDSERYFLEYFMRDAYAYYGYDFHYYDALPVDETRVRALIADFTTLYRHVFESSLRAANAKGAELNLPNTIDQTKLEDIISLQVSAHYATNFEIAELLLRGLYFVNKNGQPLRMMPRLQLDPALLETDLYH